MSTLIENLIDEVLHGKRIGGENGSCLVSNQAGLELIRHEIDSMAELEVALHEINRLLPDRTGNTDSFSGLDYVIGAYLVNGARHDAGRAIRFIESLTNELQRASIANMPVFFRRMESGYNFGVSPPEEYKTFAHRLQQSQCEEIASTAKRVFARLSV